MKQSYSEYKNIVREAHCQPVKKYIHWSIRLNWFKTEQIVIDLFQIFMLYEIVWMAHLRFQYILACTKPYYFDVADDSRVCYVEKDFSSKGIC